jgi:hypothetical protein
LHIVFCARGLVAGRDAPIDPLGGVELAPELCDLLGRENFGDLYQHGWRRCPPHSLD